jgi:hypothetical protein
MGRWVVEVQALNGQWKRVWGEYSTPPPDKGGRPEDVIREEMEAAKEMGAGWGCPMRAYWVEEKD